MYLNKWKIVATSTVTLCVTAYSTREERKWKKKRQEGAIARCETRSSSIRACPRELHVPAAAAAAEAREIFHFTWSRSPTLVETCNSSPARFSATTENQQKNLIQTPFDRRSLNLFSGNDLAHAQLKLRTIDGRKIRSRILRFWTLTFLDLRKTSIEHWAWENKK